MSTFQALGQAPLQDLLQQGRFDQVAKLLDDLELQVTAIPTCCTWYSRIE